MRYLEAIKVAYTGLGTTLGITSVAVLIGVGLGLVLALGKMSGYKLPRGIAGVYIEIIRGTPLLVQALILYVGVPSLIQSYGGVFSWRGAFMTAVCGTIACGMNSAAYVAEIIRAGLQAVDQGQIEAARSLGLTNGQTKRHIVIPQAFRIILPALGNEFITLIKETAVLSVISVVEVTREGMLLGARTFDYWPAYLGVAFVYLSITIPLSRVVRYGERRMAVSDRSE
jgi:His/Glu/Gln/Arg/opine family amino acid ABC transporter permease subunit